MPDMNQIVGSADIALIVFDTLRFDVASTEFAAGNTPNLKKLFPHGWEKRHSPGSFTYAAHHAFFAGFLPTPSDPTASQERLFATEFAGSETSGGSTRTFREANIVAGLRSEGYLTLCVGGVGFFNQQTELSRVFPAMFDEAFWSPELGVTNPQSTENQITRLEEKLTQIPENQPLFTYLNISAIHQPNCHYSPGKESDDLESHAAALRYVDSQIPRLLSLFQNRSDTFLIACSDHGTLYGEEGFTGHRVGHEAVFTVPYAEAFLPHNRVS
ncbi:MAG: STM4013/SEN3800 family hydrolase [Verrucomicrobiales bacterium]|nr:STM4013/SEN3800 family hydrolase [Verrucomicrobiales bacterium]